jgi:D-alanyl-D-alanine carboxypeptidase/D-alanyl-D-alanine-endopeptidase (penicillin-binding protein 4)
VQRELPNGYDASIQVVDLHTAAVIMEKSPDQPLVPASTMKIVTSAAALSSLKPDFTFVTEVLVETPKEGSTQRMFLRGTGDPRLVTERLFALTRKVVDTGLVHVAGDIVVDDSYFAPDAPLDEADKLGVRSYHAPYGALSLNFNSMELWIVPAHRPGMKANVFLEPESDYAEVRSDVMTVKGDKPAQVTITKSSISDKPERFSVSGEIGVSAPSKRRYVNVASPALYTGEVFKRFLKQAGVEVRGRVVRGTVTDAANLIESFPSEPLAINVYWLNKFSNNFIAEQIAMGLGAAVHGRPGTREKGLDAIARYLRHCGVDERLFVLSESSGLSRSNRLSASGLVKVLMAVSRDFSCSYEFMASLGIAGIDGTLREKFLDSGLERRIRAKTGTLRGVNALAGYGILPEGKIAAFAVIVNSTKPNAGIVDYADRIARGIFEPSAKKR